MAGKIDPVLEVALRRVKYPGLDVDIVEAGLVEEAVVEGAVAKVRLRPLSAPAGVRKALEDALAAELKAAPGIKEVELLFPPPPKAPSSSPPQPQPIEGVKWVVPVASGKGGVGKSTVAVNLAIGLRRLGLASGVLDLDVYGPSMHIMLGLKGMEPTVENNKLVPLEAWGIKVMSVGVLMDPGKALIWRGPLVMKAVSQLIRDVAWAPLDVLVLDLPPGTGDVQITMCQELPITGAVVVTTPQDVALADAIKAVDMFRTVGAPVLGVVENMSFFVCPNCGVRHEIFGPPRNLEAVVGVRMLGRLPLAMEVAPKADQGRPAITLGGDVARAYEELAATVKRVLEEGDGAEQGGSGQGS